MEPWTQARSVRWFFKETGLAAQRRLRAGTVVRVVYPGQLPRPHPARAASMAANTPPA